MGCGERVDGLSFDVGGIEFGEDEFAGGRDRFCLANFFLREGWEREEAGKENNESEHSALRQQETADDADSADQQQSARSAPFAVS
jgi:hypothetical protein